ncbi:hypothetical protein ACIO14_07070 [Nocardia fluminea]
MAPHTSYPQADVDRRTVALLLEVDPAELARPSKWHNGFALGRAVNTSVA